MDQVKAAVGGSLASGDAAMPLRAQAFGAPSSPAAAHLAAPAFRSPDAPSAPVTPTTAPLEPADALDELVGSVEAVHAALLASVDGFGIARSSTMSDEAAHPAMLAAAVGLAHQLAAMGGGDHLRQLVVEHDAGLLVVWPIGSQRVLAVLAASTVEQRRLRSFVQSRARVLSGATS